MKRNWKLRKFGKRAFMVSGFIMFGLLEVANTALLFVNVEYFGIPKMVSIIGYMILTCALEYIVLYILLSAR